MADPTSRQRGRPASAKPQMSDSNKNLVLGPIWGLTPGLTGRMPIGRNATLIWRQFSSARELTAEGSTRRSQQSGYEAGVKWSQAREDVSPEAEERPLLEAITKQRDWEH
jgi:hypothetical protein